MSKLIDEPGGILVSQALARATTAIESRRADGLASINQAIDELHLLSRSGTSESCAQMRQLASELVGAAGLFGLMEVSAASLSLVRLLSLAGEASTAAIGIHADALRTLQLPELSCDTRAKDELLRQLRKLADHAYAKVAV